MSDEKEKIEKVEASEIEPKEIKKEEKKKDKKEGKKGLIITIIILAALLFVALVGSAILFLNLTRELNDTKLRLKSISVAQYDYPIDDMDDISDEDKKIDDDMEEPVDLEQITKDVEDILGPYDFKYARETVESMGDGIKVIKTIRHIADAIGYYNAKTRDSGYGVSSFKYGDGDIYYKMNDNGDLVFIDGSFSVNYILDSWSKSEFKLVVDKALSKLGFVDYPVNIYSGAFPEVINNELGVICAPVYSDYKVSCADAWLLDEEKEVVSGVVETLRNVHPETTAPYVLNLRTMKESANHQYQNITVGVSNVGYIGGAVELFYRKKGDSNWVFVLGAQSAPACSEFSDEAKKAFEGSGEACVNPNPDGSYSEINLVYL